MWSVFAAGRQLQTVPKSRSETGDIRIRLNATKLNCETGGQSAVGIRDFENAAERSRRRVDDWFSRNQSLSERAVYGSGCVDDVVLANIQRGEMLQVSE